MSTASMSRPASASLHRSASSATGNSMLGSSSEHPSQQSLGSSSVSMYAPLELRGMQRTHRALLEHYRQKIQQLEKERQDWIDRIDDIEGHSGGGGNERMRLRQELVKARSQVEDLQRTLSDAHLQLYEERKQLIRTQAEADSLRIHEIEQSKRISHLLALTKPVKNEVTYVTDEKPASQKLGAVSGGGVHSLADRLFTKHKQESAAAEAADRTAQSVPTEHLQALQAELKSLQQQLVQQDKLHRQQLKALVEDRQLRESDIKNRESEHRNALSTVVEGVKQLEDRYKTTTKELLQQRHQAQLLERSLREKLSDRESDNSKLRYELSAAKDGRKAKTTNEYQDMQRKQRTAEEDLAIVREQYAMSQTLYEKRIAYLTDRLQQMTQKYNTLSERRELELEGFNTDYRQIRERVRQLENAIVAVRQFFAVNEVEEQRSGSGDRLITAFRDIDSDFQRLLRDLTVVSQRLQLSTT